ncbi:MAG: VOC family protein [Caldilineaceae bacterium]|nr:VOC family protein [Caldilineaceae bacterium]
MTTYLEAKAAGSPTWTDHASPDAEAARNFYHAVFGWQYDIGGPEFGGYTTARLGAYPVAGMSAIPESMPDLKPNWGLYFASNDINADVARAEALGAKIIFPVMEVGPFGSMVHLEDPTGAQFALWQAASHVGWQVSNEPGSIAWLELYSPNAKAARDFYAAMLNTTADPMPGGMEYYVLKQGDDQLCGIMQIDPAWGPMPAQWVNYFAVANADETVATVIKHGGQQMGGIDDSPFGRIAALMDPFGAIFKIVQPPVG